MSDLLIAKTLDTSGLSCPMPVVKTKKAMKDLEIGEILEMISTDPGSIPDMEAWARQTKHDLVESFDEEDSYRFLIRKTH
jgi:tRNA 2-thiouridine synthesizing protein A